MSFNTPAEGDQTMGNVIGYARVSTIDQNPQAQHDALDDAGATRVFVDHA